MTGPFSPGVDKPELGTDEAKYACSFTFAPSICLHGAILRHRYDPNYIVMCKLNIPGKFLT
jgi:hypothetical protein